MRLTWLDEASPTRGAPSWLAPAIEPVEVPPSPPPPVIEVPVMAPSIQTADHEAELAGLRQALGATLTRLASLRQEIAIELEPRIVELAIAIAERIVDGAMDPERVVQWVREGIAQLDAQSAITVRVSPHVWESVPRETWDAIGATVSVDPSMARWDCVIENADGRVDGGASSRLRAVAEALGVEDT